jgi:hypothetical protein
MPDLTKVGTVVPITKELLLDSGRYGCDCPCHRKSPKKDLGCPCAPIIRCRFCGRRHGRRYACDELIAELLTGWVIAYCAELPADPDAGRYGHSSPVGQRYHVSHGLAAGLMAAFNNGTGTPSNDGEGAP